MLWETRTTDLGCTTARTRNDLPCQQLRATQRSTTQEEFNDSRAEQRNNMSRRNRRGLLADVRAAGRQYGGKMARVIGGPVRLRGCRRGQRLATRRTERVLFEHAVLCEHS